ncbi:MAG: universal stress protein [Myxococcota bacterium]
MEPFRSILSLVDFSPASAHAVALGADLSRRYGASLLLVHVFDPLPYALPDIAWLYTAEQQSRLTSELENSLRAAQRDAEAAGAAQVTTRLLQGSPTATIVDFVDSNHIDLVVMGSHGRTGFKRLLLGSVAESVSRAVSCTVVIARSRPQS